jgi:hypothetical protein
MSFEINDMKLFATWSHNKSYNTDCTICRCPLNNNSMYLKDKKKYVSDVAFNTCGHGYHKDCIISWLNINRHCPNCSAKWQTEI